MRTYDEVELYILLHANALLEYLPYVAVGDFDPTELAGGYSRYTVEDGDEHYGNVFVDERTAELGWHWVAAEPRSGGVISFGHDTPGSALVHLLRHLRDTETFEPTPKDGNG